MSSKQLAVIENHFTPEIRGQFGEVLQGTRLTEKRLVRSVLWAVDTNPRLLECMPNSLVRFGMTCAVLALEPGPAHGQIFAIPFRNKKAGTLEAQTVIGYKGYNTLGHRDGIAIDGDDVRDGDTFRLIRGSHTVLEYERGRGRGRAMKEIERVWAMATTRDRVIAAVELDRDEIEFVRSRSPAVMNKGETPWNDPRIGLPAMAVKTAKRRLSRALPLAAYLMAASMEEAHEERGRYAWIDAERRVRIEGDEPATVGATTLIQPPQTTEDRAAVLKPRKFPLFKNRKGERRDLDTIEDWRSYMEIAINSLRHAEHLEQFRDLNSAIMDGLRDEFPEHVNAVGDLIAKRLKEM